MARKPRQSFYTEGYLKAFTIENDVCCWIWQGARQPNGYGRVACNQTGTTMVHRVMYVLVHGAISSEVEIDHKCNNRACINPLHLHVVTHQENKRLEKERNKSKTHCLRGHEYTKENVYIDPKGTRICRKCKVILQQNYEERKRITKLPLDLFALFKVQE
jgi:hypothetical protein